MCCLTLRTTRKKGHFRKRNYMYFRPKKWPKMLSPPTFAPLSSHLNTFRNYKIIMPINNSSNPNNPMPYEVRKVQDSSRLVFITVPKRFADSMGIKKASLVKIQYDKNGRTLIITKVHIDGEDSSSSQITN